MTKTNRPKLTEQLARNIATDEANRSMRAAGRKVWSEVDYNVAARTFNGLMDTFQPEGAL